MVDIIAEFETVIVVLPLDEFHVAVCEQNVFPGLTVVVPLVRVIVDGTRVAVICLLDQPYFRGTGPVTL